MGKLQIKFKKPPTFDEDPMNFILGKYKSLQKTLTDLMGPSFKEFITGIYIVAPKPTTFKIVLNNNQEVILQYLGRSYEAKIEGKKYYLENSSELLGAVKAIAAVLQLGQPLGLDTGGGDSPEGPADDAGGEDTAADDAGAEEEPAEEPLQEGLFGKKFPDTVNKVLELIKQGKMKDAIELGNSLSSSERDMIPDSILFKMSMAEGKKKLKLRIKKTPVSSNDDNPFDKEGSKTQIAASAGSIAVLHKELSNIINKMKQLAGEFKAGNTSVLPELKTLTVRKKQIEAELLAVDQDDDTQLDEINKSASIPSNIAEFAKRNGVLPDVKQIAKWAAKCGKRIVGGTAIGKGYSTLILDLTYQGGEVRFDINSGKITVGDNDMPVSDYKSFEQALKSNSSDEEQISEANEGSIFKDLNQAKEYAKQVSHEEGVVQHVNELRLGTWEVSDWYDNEQTVCSYQGGIQMESKNAKHLNEVLANDPLLKRLMIEDIDFDLLSKYKSKFGITPTGSDLENFKNKMNAPEPVSSPTSVQRKGLSPKKAQQLAILKREREKIMSDMEQEAEPEGGLIADKYGALLNKIDKAIYKLQDMKGGANRAGMRSVRRNAELKGLGENSKGTNISNLKVGARGRNGFTAYQVKKMDGSGKVLVITHGGNMGNTIERSVDPNLKAMGLPTIAQLKKYDPKFKEEGTPDYAYYFRIQLEKGSPNVKIRIKK